MEIEIDDFTLDQHIQHYIERLMEKKIGHYLQHQLKGVIEAQLAALRLHDPTFPSFESHITDVLSAKVEAEVRRILPALTTAEVKGTLRKLANNIG